MAKLTEQRTLYKVLNAQGESFHGGFLKWSLPKQKADGTFTPGKWHKVSGKIELCSTGLHLTSEPVNWWASDAVCYVAEYRGDMDSSEGGDKIAVSEARLVRVLSADELVAVRVFTSGIHSVSAGNARAYDSAMVEAYGSAMVEAHDSATVEAHDSAIVEAHDSAIVEAHDSAIVEAYDSAMVEAYGSAMVKAYGSAIVEAHDSATVEAHDSAMVLTFYTWAQPVIVVKDKSVWIDRRTSPPTVYGAVTLAVEAAK